MKLTTEDRFQIEELYARYAWSFDYGSPEEWTDVFTDDALLARKGHPDVRGTQELRQFAEERGSSAPGIIHHNSNVSIRATEDGASGRAYCLVLRTTQSERLRIRNFATYEDDLVKIDGVWLFKERRIEFFLAPEYVDAAFELDH